MIYEYAHPNLDLSGLLNTDDQTARFTFPYKVREPIEYEPLTWERRTRQLSHRLERFALVDSIDLITDETDQILPIVNFSGVMIVEPGSHLANSVSSAALRLFPGYSLDPRDMRRDRATSLLASCGTVIADIYLPALLRRIPH